MYWTKQVERRTSNLVLALSFRFSQPYPNAGTREANTSSRFLGFTRGVIEILIGVFPEVQGVQGLSRNQIIKQIHNTMC